MRNQSKSENSSGNYKNNNNIFSFIMDNLEIRKDDSDLTVSIDGEKIEITEEDRQLLQQCSGISFINGVLKVYGKVIYPKEKVTEGGTKNGCCSIF